MSYMSFMSFINFMRLMAQPDTEVFYVSRKR